MTRACDRLCLFVVLVGLSGAASPAFAQNWMTDARRVAMGGVGGSENLASRMVESPEGPYTNIVIPLGLFQVLSDFSIYDPSSENFDPIRATENVVAPLHFTFDREGNGIGADFINDLLDGRLSRNINAYRGFIPTSQPVGYGLWAPSWGATIPVRKQDNGTRHSVYVGAGPYLPFRGSVEVDDQLNQILSSETNVTIPPNTRFTIISGVRVELPVAITGGYRGRLNLWDTSNDRDGLYVAFNYNYLRGFWYEDAVMTLRLDTDNQGLLTLTPSSNPVEVVRLSSQEGRGFGMDVGVAAVVKGIEFGVGVNGIANRIKWTEIEGYRYSLSNIVTGDGEFQETLGANCPASGALTFPDCVPTEMTVEQPIEYVASAGYHARRWQVMAEFGTRSSNYRFDEGRLGSAWFHSGFEYRFGLLEPRAGAYYSRDRWRPAAGLGLNFGKFGVDTAVYWNDSNIEHLHHPAIALSLRIGSRDAPAPTP